jgi:hypothetical protein
MCVMIMHIFVCIHAVVCIMGCRGSFNVYFDYLHNVELQALKFRVRFVIQFNLVKLASCSML